MRKLCPNTDREDSLDTVLEVPIPEEMIAGAGNNKHPQQKDVHAWLKTQAFDKVTADIDGAPLPLSGRNAELQLLLNVVGAPLLPSPVPFDQAFSRSIRNCSTIQASTAKYIIQQYVAATGGQAALTSVHSMYAIGKVRMNASAFHMGDAPAPAPAPAAKGKGGGAGEIGGYVLWQKNPDLWYLEFILSGSKLSAGSDGKLAWRKSALDRSTHASRGPPRPLRRSFQGLDPRSTASLFSDAVCIGEKVINGEECFILKLEASPAALRSRNAAGGFDVIQHKVWGYFSQRTGLLVQLDDSSLLGMKARRGESIFWETSVESAVEDYRYVDGVNIAHAGRTSVTLFRYGEGSVNHRRRMDEAWTIEEVDFNIWGLSADCFLPPAELAAGY